MAETPPTTNQSPAQTSPQTQNTPDIEAEAGESEASGGGEKKEGCCLWWIIGAILLFNLGGIIITMSLVGFFTGSGFGLDWIRGTGGVSECTSNQMAQGLLDTINKNKGVYQAAASQTGIPWEFLVGLHYRETNFGNSAANGDGPFQVQGAKYQTFGIESAVEAAEKAKSLVKGSYGKTLGTSSDSETIKLAFLAYNRGVMYKRAGCTPDQSPYVMNNFDDAHKNMRWPDNACEVVPPPTIVKGKVENGRLGAFTVFSILKGNVTGSDSCNQPAAPIGALCGVIPVSIVNVEQHGGDLRLMPPAANDFNKMAAEFKQRTGRAFPVTSMFRSRQTQIGLCGDVKPNGKCTNPLANPPGTSMHEAGLAIDTSTRSSYRLTPAQYQVLIEIDEKYNFKLNNTSYGAAESWHLDYIGTKDQFWYGAKITNAIETANRTNCTTGS